MSRGRLFVVATPIGNLGDLGARASEVLASVDVVVAEDTRRTRALLSHLGVRGKRLLKIDAHASERALGQVLDALEAGRDVALATDAGTPSVSDPGAALVRAAVERDVTVVAVPGASAITAAIAVSGLVDGPFSFLAFLPRKGEKRRRVLARIARAEEPVVLFESPQRIARTLDDLAALDPTRPAVVCRELTKVHEETLRGSVGELAARVGIPKGEITVVLGAGIPPAEEGEGDVDALVQARLAAGQTPRDAAKEVAELTGQPRRAVYARVLELTDTEED